MDIATDADTRSQTIPASPSEDRSANTGPPPHRPLVFVAALSTIFMVAIEGTIVATAMPTIVGALGGIDLFTWIFGAYLLTQAVLIPIYGRLSDIYGRKPVLLFGIGVFLVGSTLCGFAWNMISLIAFRVVQGIGAGALIPVSQTVVADIYTGEARARMQGYISSTFGSAAVIGPMIGGADRDSRELESDFLDQHPARHHRRFAVDYRAQGRGEEAAPPDRLHRCGADGVVDHDHHDRADPRRYVQHHNTGRGVLRIRGADRRADLLREPDI